MARRRWRWWLGVAAVAAVALLWLHSHLAPPELAVPPRGVVLRDVTVVNPGRASEPGRTVVVRGDAIEAIEATRRGEEPGPYAGSFVLPGLVDMHVHHPPATAAGDLALFGLLFLSHGVTAVRDTGSFDGAILSARDAVRRGEWAGPRIFACGPILDGDPPYWPGSRVVRDAAEARRVVAELARKGVDCIKVYERLSAEALAAIVAEAHGRGLPVVGHVPRSVRLARSGIDDVQHLTGVAPRGEKIDESLIRALVTASVVRGIEHTPTLVVLDRLSRLLDGSPPPPGTGAELLPRYYREVIWNPRYDRRLGRRADADWAAMRETIRNAKRIVLRLHRAGVRIHVGTDTMNPYVVPGFSLHEEMRELVDAGLTPEEVWRAATAEAGDSLGVPGLGVVRSGAPADLLVFSEDPTRDLGALDSLEAVVADGRLYPREELDAALERWREHEADPVFDALTMALARWIAPRAAPPSSSGGSLRPPRR